MIAHIHGTLDKKTFNRVVIDANGVGYEIAVLSSTVEKLPLLGSTVKLYTVESTSLYGGGTSLYGFLTEEEKEFYLLLKNEIPGAGAKKALDYLEKISKSLPDFKQAILKKDVALLTSVFGFTKKTAETILNALKNKISDIQTAGKEKWKIPTYSSSTTEAIAGLIALGYKEIQARDAVEKCIGIDEKNTSVEDIIREALRNL